MTCRRIIVIVIALASLACAGKGADEAPPPQTTNQRLRAAAPAPVPAPPREMSTNAKLFAKLRVNQGTQCQAESAFWVSESIRHLEEAINHPKNPREVASLLFPHEGARCRGPDGVWIENFAVARDILCNRSGHDLLVYCNTSYILTPEQMKQYPGLDPSRHYFPWTVAAHGFDDENAENKGNTLPHPECYCQ